MPETTTCYFFDSDNYYIQDGIARRDPREWKIRSTERYLLPSNATFVSPHPIPKGQLAKWNGSLWDYEPPKFIIKTGVTTRLSSYTLNDEVIAQFPTAEVIVLTEGKVLEDSDPKDIKFDNIDDTAGNNTIIDNLISSHDFGAGNITAIRFERDNKLTLHDWIIRRHEEEIELVSRGIIGNPTLTDTKYEDWLKYRQQLRDFPTTCDPEKPTWPDVPPEK